MMDKTNPPSYLKPHVVFTWTWGSALVLSPWTGTGGTPAPGTRLRASLRQEHTGRALLSKPLHQPPHDGSVELEQSWEKFNPWSSTQANKLVKRLLFPPSLQSCPLHRAIGKKVAICLVFALKRKRHQSSRTASPRACYSSTDPSAALAQGATEQRFFRKPASRREPGLQLFFSYIGNFNWD